MPLAAGPDHGVCEHSSTLAHAAEAHTLADADATSTCSVATAAGVVSGQPDKGAEIQTGTPKTDVGTSAASAGEATELRVPAPALAPTPAQEESNGIGTSADVPDPETPRAAAAAAGSQRNTNGKRSAPRSASPLRSPTVTAVGKKAATACRPVPELPEVVATPLVASADAEEEALFQNVVGELARPRFTSTRADPRGDDAGAGVGPDAEKPEPPAKAVGLQLDQGTAVSGPLKQSSLKLHFGHFLKPFPPREAWH